MLSFVRHAPVLVGGLCYGQADVPTAALGDLGEALGRCVEHILERSQGRALSVVSSPSRRTVELANYLVEHLPAALPLRLDTRLLEHSMGAWEGRSYAELEATDGARFTDWMRHWQTQAPPGGETLEQFSARVAGCLTELSEHEDVLVVTHAGVIRAYWVLTGERDWTGAMHQSVPFLGVVAGAGAGAEADARAGVAAGGSRRR